MTNRRMQYGLLGVFLVVWLCSCSDERAATIEPSDPRSEVVGDFERVDVSGVVVKIKDTIPTDGGVLILRLQNRDGDLASVFVRGATWGYEPTKAEQIILHGAFGVRIGDLMEAQITGGYVSGFRVTRM